MQGSMYAFAFDFKCFQEFCTCCTFAYIVLYSGYIENILKNVVPSLPIMYLTNTYTIVSNLSFALVEMTPIHHSWQSYSKNDKRVEL